MKRIIDSFGRYTKGDWVRFYSGGKLIIGEVNYIYEKPGGFIRVATDQGPVDVKSILEVRSADAEKKKKEYYIRDLNQNV